MSAFAGWDQDSSGNYYRWEAAHRCYVYPNGRRYYPDSNRWVEPAQPPQPSQGALYTPRVANAQATQHEPTSRAPDHQPSTSDTLSPTVSISRPQYTTARERQASFSSGGSNDLSTRPGLGPSQLPTGQGGGGQASWSATLTANRPGQGYGRTSTEDVPRAGSSVSYDQRGLTSARPLPGQGTAGGQAGYASSTRSTSTSRSALAAAPGPSHNTTRSIHGQIQNSTPGEFERLDPRYRQRDHDFFRQYRVFKMHWAQPATGSGGTNVTAQREPLPSKYEKYLPKNVVRDRQFGQYIFTKIRWFVVVKEGADKCLCVPIVTHQGKGVKERGVKHEHAIVYTTRDAPAATPEEMPRRGERPMRTSIRVQTDERGDKLADMSRIDYGRVYTVEHNIKAMAFGWIHESSRRNFSFDFLNVFMGEQGYRDWLEAQQQAEADEDSDDSEDDDDDEQADNGAEDDDDDNDGQGGSGGNASRSRHESSRSQPPAAASSKSAHVRKKRSSK